MRIESQIGGPSKAAWPAPVREPARAWVSHAVCGPKSPLTGLPGPITVLTWAAAQQVGDAFEASRFPPAPASGLAVDYADWLRRANREDPRRHPLVGAVAVDPSQTCSEPTCGRAAGSSPPVPHRRTDPPRPTPALVPGPETTPANLDPSRAQRSGKAPPPGPGTVLMIRSVPNPVARLIDLIA